MSEVWQNWIIAFSIVGAVAYLGLRFVRWRQRRSACGDCKLRKMALGEDPETTKNRATD